MTLSLRYLTLPGHDWAVRRLGAEEPTWHLVRLDGAEGSPLSERACRAAAVEVVAAGPEILCAACLRRLLCASAERSEIYG